MSRVPNCRTPGEEARRFLKHFDRQIAAYERRDYPYAWTTSDDEIADDAIMVGIGGTDANMLTAGLAYVEPTASIYWCARLTGQGMFEAGGEMGPWSVPEALDRAHALRIVMGYDRVVVTMSEVGIWCDVWGRLADREGY